MEKKAYPLPQPPISANMFYSETLSLSGSSESSSSCSSCDKCNENNGDHGEFGSFRFVSSFPYSGFLVSELL